MSDNVQDNRGFSVSPSSGKHVYGYDGSGRLITDTLTIETEVWVKTFTYNGTGQLIGESTWVAQ